MNSLNYSLSFNGYKAPVKSWYKRGMFEGIVTKGFYGETLTRKNVSLEHLSPHSKGGRECWNNLVLTSKGRNRNRGSRPLIEFAKPENIRAYLAQFEGIHIPGKSGFDGNAYIRMIKKHLRDMKIPF